VLLCEETVSLLGIRQFYALVGDSSADSNIIEESNSTSSVTMDPLQADASVAAAGSTSKDPSDSSQQQPAEQQQLLLQQQQQPAEQQQQQQAAEEVAQGQKAEQQLSIAQQQQLLVLKVEALLQLLSSVSFHQVRPPPPWQVSFVGTRCELCVPTNYANPQVCMFRPAAA
jgi:hypothetical protein